MMLHKGLVAELGSNTISSGFLVDGAVTRVFPQVIPQNRPRGETQVPAVVFSTVAVDRQVTYCGTSGLKRSTLRLDCYAISYDGAKDLAEAVAGVLLDFRGMLGDIADVRHAALESEIDLQEFEPGLYRVSQTWTFWHSDTE